MEAGNDKQIRNSRNTERRYGAAETKICRAVQCFWKTVALGQNSAMILFFFKQKIRTAPKFYYKDLLVRYLQPMKVITSGIFGSFLQQTLVFVRIGNTKKLQAEFLRLFLYIQTFVSNPYHVFSALN